MRIGPTFLARVTLGGYVLVLLFFVLGALYPGVNPDPTQWFYFPPLWYVAGLCVFPLSILCACTTGAASLVVLLRANRLEWSGAFAVILLTFAGATLFSIGTVLSRHGIIGGVHTTIGVGITFALALLLLPVLTLIAFRNERTAPA